MSFSLPTPIRSPAFILTLFGIVLMAPALMWGPGFTHSHQYNLIWTAHFGQEMAAGHLYERWLPDSFEGLGSPTFYFYPPFSYWIGGVFHALGFTVPTAVNMAGLALLVASGLAMHHWLSARNTRPMLGAMLYMAAPYHLYDIYVRGALAEVAAFIWLPLIALAIDRLPAPRGVMLLAVAYAGLLISHLPLAMLTGLFLIGPLIGWRLWQRDRVLTPAALAGAMAFALAAFYLIPALTLQSHISTSMLWGRDYRATDWSILNSHFTLFPCLAIGLILLAWPAARTPWGMIAILTALLSIRLIPFVWEIDLLNKVQFPWRALCIAEFATVTALAGSRLRPWITGMAVAFLLFPYIFGALLAFTYMRMPVDQTRIERIAPDAPEYLPHGFNLSRVRADNHWVDLAPWRALPRADSIMVNRAGQVELGHAAFPIWQVMRDGSPVASSGPLIRFDATPGLYRIVRVLLWQEVLGGAISLIAWAMLAALVIRQRAISHLSKFPFYSPFQQRSDRSRQHGGVI